MIMGGTMGPMLLAEFEFLRSQLVALFKYFGLRDVADAMPKSVNEQILTNSNIATQLMEEMYKGMGASDEFAQNAAIYGVPSAATGMDIGSGLRFQSVVPGMGEGQQFGFLNSLPVIKFGSTIFDAVTTKASEVVGGERTEAELRKSDMSVQPMVGTKFLIDKFRHGSDDRSFVPGGGRNYAQVRQTPEEQLAQFLGTQTLSTSKDKMIVTLEKEHEKKLATERQHAIDLMVDGILHGKNEKTSKGIDLAIKYEMSPDMIKSAVTRAIKERHSPRREDLYGTIPKSREQKRRFLEDLKYE
jgi:hypothetical protein